MLFAIGVAILVSACMLVLVVGIEYALLFVNNIIWLFLVREETLAMEWGDECFNMHRWPLLMVPVPSACWMPPIPFMAVLCRSKFSMRSGLLETWEVAPLSRMHCGSQKKLTESWGSSALFFFKQAFSMWPMMWQ